MKTAVRRIVYIIAFAMIGVYGFIALRGPQGIPALLEKRKEIRDLEEQNATTRRENEYRRARIQKLQDSPSEQEMEIRKKLHMLRQGETSFILPDQPKADKPQPDGASAPQ
jgi:cell division protein FtsB